jgi:hypothetical protein
MNSPFLEKPRFIQDQAFGIAVAKASLPGMIPVKTK